MLDIKESQREKKMLLKNNADLIQPSLNIRRGALKLELTSYQRIHTGAIKPMDVWAVGNLPDRNQLLSIMRKFM